MYYYAHHIGDFQRDTAMLTDHQTMTYLRMIWLYYDTEAPLPDDSTRLSFKVGSDPDTVYLLLDHFFERDGDVWRHTRCDREIEQYRRKSDRAKAAAEKRWGNADAVPTQCDRNADAVPTQTDGKPEAKKQFTPPSVEEVREYAKERLSPVDPQRFHDFYASKGWMVGKAKMKDWRAALRGWEQREQADAPEKPRQRRRL